MVGGSNIPRPSKQECEGKRGERRQGQDVWRTRVRASRMNVCQFFGEQRAPVQTVVIRTEPQNPLTTNTKSDVNEKILPQET